MQFRRSVGLGVLASVLFLMGAILDGVLWRYPQWLGIDPGSERQADGLWAVSALTLAVTLLVAGYALWLRQWGHSAYGELKGDDSRPATPAAPVEAQEDQAGKWGAEMKAHLYEHYGFAWRCKIRLLLVVGERAEVEAIAPGLGEKHWLHGQDTVLVWGGGVQVELSPATLALCSRLSRFRSLDGVIWVLDKQQSLDDTAMGNGIRRLQDLARKVHWQLPLYLWQVCASQWPQATRETQAVGCLLPSRLGPQALESHLTQLVEPLRQSGLEQMQSARSHDFLLRLSHDLKEEGIARWRQVLAPLLGEFSRGVPLRGLWFSLALPAGKPGKDGKPDKRAKDHYWPLDPTWQGVLDDKHVHSRRLGWPASRIAYALTLGLALLWGVGLLLSFTSNRAHIAQVQDALVALEQAGQGDAQLNALNDLTRELGRLDYRAEHGVPWYLRFGLSQNDPLLDALWPRYVEANHRLLRDPAAANLQRQLSALVTLPPDSPERAARATVAYDQLKAYLMMAHPEKAEPSFLVQTLGAAEPLRDGVVPGLWQGLSPTLWRFYAEHLAAHLQWRITVDPKLVAQVRQVLLGQLGQRNAEASLYQQVLDTAANHSPDMNLAQMVGDTEAQALFSTRASVPGVFTRQAWEGQVRGAIDEIAEARREEIDWVLSDKPGDIAHDLTPEVLKQRLTERYFQDYASAWLDVLNSLRWQPAGSLDEVIDQLTLMSDVRQSPLIALINTLAYQGQAGTRRQALGDSLIQSAQQLIGQDQVPAIDQQAHGPSSPLEATFDPLLALLGKGSEGANTDSLSLQAFLNRVTRVRLKLQQVSNAPDPQAMTQALAQSVFQGKGIDLTETQSYGSLIAASLGAEWGSVGQTLFVQPLDQAWERVLQPSAASFNRQWQRAIVTPWQDAFAGRYPFAATASDASLPMLGQMIRADSGRLDQFLQSQLGGVLRKEGSRWVADPRHSQGLRFNPQFLSAINQLSHLADVLYTDGGLGLGFELRGKPVRDVVQTTFILNGERHEYFNQKESWQRFNWPGRSDHPGASLTWTSVRAGERLFGDYQGTWGLIRWLEHAKVTPLDDGDSRYQVVLKAPDGLGLTWHLRTELGAGPMALLKLRGFTLPGQIFLSESVAKNGRFE